MPEKNYFVHESSYVDDNVGIGEGTKIWHFSHIQGGAKIGIKCSIGQNVYVGSNVIVGNYVKIQNNVSVYEGVELEDYVFCGPSMVFTNILDPRSEFPQRGSDFYIKTLVKRSASLGANCTIICGITIGEYAFVGAGAVVTRDVPDYGLVKGTPAHLTAWMCACGKEKLDLTLDPDSEETAECRNCGRKYKKTNMIVEEI
jgi:UDP-2-acetamido-3-amino-2,3-dideoxy-glucuronate N-acetyltransferase